MVGRSRSSSVLKVVWILSKNSRTWEASLISTRREMSAPAEKARPAPVSTGTRTLLSLRTAAVSSRKSAIIAGLIALSLSGRLSRASATPSSHRYSSVWYMSRILHVSPRNNSAHKSVPPGHLPGVIAAVDAEHRASDVRGRRAREIDHGSTNLLGPAKAAHRSEGLGAFSDPGLLEPPLNHLCRPSCAELP